MSALTVGNIYRISLCNLRSLKVTMVALGVVGQVEGSGDQLSFEWKIPEFLSLSSEIDACYSSPAFFACGTFWCLNIFTNGQRWNSSEGYIGIFTQRLSSGPPVCVNHSASLKKTIGKKSIFGAEDTFTVLKKSWGGPEVLRRSKLIEEKNEFLPEGALTVVCSLKSDETRTITAAQILKKAVKVCITSVHASTQTDEDIGTRKLLSDLEGLAVSGDETDVTVSVQGEEFRLHRAIMAARTPVFNSMFKHNMTEKSTGVVSIDDCEAGAFRVFVHYLYTGSTQQLSPENVISVYKIADKYHVDELKASCLGILKCSLSVATFSDVVDLALKYDEEDLKEEVTVFLSENTVDVIATKEWRTLLRQNLIEVNELLKNALMRKQDE